MAKSKGSEMYRLPRGVSPLRYDLFLGPDIQSQQFTGSVSIVVEVSVEVASVVCHAVELEIDTATLKRRLSLTDLDPSSEADGDVTNCAVTVDAQRELVCLTPPQAVMPGTYDLVVKFRGALRHDSRGLYLSLFTEESAETGAVIMTQMAPRDARRVFPCFDEPDRKAVFGVTVDLPANLEILSNSPARQTTLLPGNMKRVEFADTIPLSTYLVVIIVGAFRNSRSVEVGRTTLQLWQLRGSPLLADVALDVASRALEWFTDYFGVEYPSTKLDLVAVPELAGSAMENFGCIVFREDRLLVDKRVASQRDLSEVTEVIAHEISHMWLGDLVTMKWWNASWLKEGLATFMAAKAVESLWPHQRPWESLQFRAEAAKMADGFPSALAIEPAHGSTDAARGTVSGPMIYHKGASIIRMLENLIGSERFREGVTNYLRLYQFGNTEPADLWEAIGGIYDGKSIAELLQPWFSQPGLPELDVCQEGRRLVVTQRPFNYPSVDPSVSTPRSGRVWTVPAIVSIYADDERQTSQYLISEACTHLDVGEDSVAVANGDGLGFYRVRYAGTLSVWTRNHLSLVSPLERVSLLTDAWAGLVSRSLPLSVYLRVVRGCQDDHSADVWRVISGQLRSLRAAANPGQRALVGDLVGEVAGTTMLDSGSELGIAQSLDGRTELLGELLRVRARAGEDPATLEWGQLYGRHGLEDLEELSTSERWRELSGALVEIYVAGGDSSAGLVVLKRLTACTHFQLRRRLLVGLASARRTETLQLLLAKCVSSLHGGDLGLLLGMMLRSTDAQAGTWQFILDNWTTLREQVPKRMFLMLWDALGEVPDGDQVGREFLVDSLESIPSSWLSEVDLSMCKRAIERTSHWREFAHWCAPLLGEALVDSGGLSSVGE